MGASLPTRAISAVIVGGTVSEITGGKFANGAATGAFQFVMNAAQGAANKKSESEAEDRISRGNFEDGKIAWVGGANDANSGIVKDLMPKTQNNTYFEHSDGEKKLESWIQENKGFHLTVIAHSCDGNTAANIIARGNYVDKFISVDPVGRRWSRPNFDRVAKYTGYRINYNSSGGGITGSNTVALFGGAYNGAPKRYANEYYDIALEHVAICYEYCKP